MIVYITKYALSEGIQEMEGKICDSVSNDMIEVRGQGFPQYFHKNEWFDNKEDAIIYAEKLRQKKIASIYKSLDKLNKLSFK